MWQRVGDLLFRLLLILLMIAGGLFLFIGALGVFNEGFRDEVRGAPIILLAGLGMMIASWAAQRRTQRPVSRRKQK